MVGIYRIGENFVVTLFWSRLREMSTANEVEYHERELHLRRNRFYAEYQIVIARALRHRRWSLEAAGTNEANVVRLPARRQ